MTTISALPQIPTGQDPHPQLEGKAKRSARHWLWLATAIAVLITGRIWLWPHDFYGIPLQAQEPMTDFSLMTSTGQPMRLSDFRGKYVLLLFGYTSCPDVCPMTLVDLVQTRARLGTHRADVQVILVSVDPERDTPQRLAGYLAAFDPSFLGMTGSPDEVSAIATRFGVFFDVANGQGNFVEHSGTVTLLDPNGYVRLLFPPGTTGEEMASDLSYLMQR